MSGTKLIIGIDFGTTFSGVSWATTAGRREVHVIDDWPHPHGRNTNDHQVPSVIVYDKYTHQVSKWGHHVREQDNDLFRFRWMKILLDPAHKYYKEAPQIKGMVERLNKIGKTAEQVVADYLKCIWDHTLATLRRKHEEVSLYTMKVVLTVPAVWSPAAKDKTLQAARKAGLPVDIMLVTEPEAAALAVLKDKSEEETVSQGDAFVICDAGGGTVDLISYKVESLKPLRIKECVMGDGGLCGAIFLDQEFERHIRTRVGAAQYDRLSGRHKAYMLANFESGLKRSFEKDARFKLTVELQGIDDNEEDDIEDETITIPYRTMQEIFDSICLKIQALVDKQLAGIRQKGLRGRAVVLVGGFGESKYLHYFLETATKRAYSSVKVLQDTRAISAVCRGATHWGLEQSAGAERSVMSRISRISYGISYTPLFNPLVHVEADKFLCSSDGLWRANGQMTWLLKRGDEVIEGRILEGSTSTAVDIETYTGESYVASQTLWYTTAEVPPTRKADPRVKLLATALYSIPTRDIRGLTINRYNGKNWRDVIYSRDIQCGGTTLQFRIMYKSTLIQATDVAYVDDCGE